MPARQKGSSQGCGMQVEQKLPFLAKCSFFGQISLDTPAAWRDLLILFNIPLTITVQYCTSNEHNLYFHVDVDYYLIITWLKCVHIKYLKRQGVKDVNIRIAAIANNTPLSSCANGDMKRLKAKNKPVLWNNQTHSCSVWLKAVFLSKGIFLKLRKLTKKMFTKVLTEFSENM